MENNDSRERLVYTPTELCHLLHCGRGLVYELIRTGAIGHLRVSKRKIIVPRACVLMFLEQAGKEEVHSDGLK